MTISGALALQGVILLFVAGTMRLAAVNWLGGDA